MKLRATDAARPDSASHQLYWLSLDHNLLPMRWESRTRNNGHVSLLVRTVPNLLTIGEGVAFPKRVQSYFVSRTPEAREFKIETLTTIVVAKATLKPQIPDGLFDKPGQPPKQDPPRMASSVSDRSVRLAGAMDNEKPAEKPGDSGVQAIVPLLEFRFAAQPADSKFEPCVPADYEQRDYSGNTVIGRMIARDKGFIWVPVAESKDRIAALPVERLRGGQVREALLADTPEHALAWNGKWSVEACRVVADPNGGGRFSIELKLNEAGGAAMSTLTKSHLNQPLAILVDGEIITAPIVRNEVGRDCVITGNFTREQADKLATKLVVLTANQDGE